MKATLQGSCGEQVRVILLAFDAKLGAIVAADDPRHVPHQSLGGRDHDSMPIMLTIRFYRNHYLFMWQRMSDPTRR